MVTHQSLQPHWANSVEAARERTPARNIHAAASLGTPSSTNSATDARVSESSSFPICLICLRGGMDKPRDLISVNVLADGIGLCLFLSRMRRIGIPETHGSRTRALTYFDFWEILDKRSSSGHVPILPTTRRNSTMAWQRLFGIGDFLSPQEKLIPVPI